MTQQQKKVQYWETLYGMKQLISDRTDVSQHSSSCIDLIFVEQTNLVINSSIHPSLHRNCCYHVIIVKLKFCNYRKETDLINRKIDQFDWFNLFLDKNINEQVILFN